MDGSIADNPEESLKNDEQVDESNNDDQEYKEACGEWVMRRNVPYSWARGHSRVGK